MSSVGGWNVEARDSSLKAGPASNTVTGTPARTRLAAALSPTGPAPAISTRSVTPSLNLRHAGLGDDVAPLHDLDRDELAGLVRRDRRRLGADLREPGAHRRIVDRGLQLAVELVDDLLR